MRHQVFGKKLKRSSKERKALFKGLISSLVLRGQVKTTEAKAKAIRGQIDKIISKTKKGTLDSRRQLLSTLGKISTKKLFDEILPGFSSRSSGFTQIIKIGPRKGDGAPMVLLQWVGREAVFKKEGKEGASGKTDSLPEVASEKSEEKAEPKSLGKTPKKVETQKKSKNDQTD